jgi:hypothetical protein
MARSPQEGRRETIRVRAGGPAQALLMAVRLSHAAARLLAYAPDMKPNRLAALPAAALALALATAGPASAGRARAGPLPCRAHMSNAHPADYTTTYVRVRTADLAHVTTVAHYKTTNHKKKARAGTKGRASIPYYISGATPGYRVKVSVTVGKGSRSGHCSTSFTPHR